MRVKLFSLENNRSLGLELTPLMHLLRTRGRRDNYCVMSRLETFIYIIDKAQTDNIA